MPSKESEAVRELYLNWTAARLKGDQHDDEAWGDLTARAARGRLHRDRRGWCGGDVGAGGWWGVESMNAAHERGGEGCERHGVGPAALWPLDDPETRLESPSTETDPPDHIEGGLVSGRVRRKSDRADQRKQPEAAAEREYRVTREGLEQRPIPARSAPLTLDLDRTAGRRDRARARRRCDRRRPGRHPARLAVSGASRSAPAAGV
jgi:hypothetical protein